MYMEETGREGEGFYYTPRMSKVLAMLQWGGGCLFTTKNRQPYVEKTSFHYLPLPDCLPGLVS